MVKKQPLSLKSRGVNSSKDTPAETQKPAPEAEVIKRLTLDMPQSLHTKLKMQAIKEGTTMAKMVRNWIDVKVG